MQTGRLGFSGVTAFRYQEKLSDLSIPSNRPVTPKLLLEYVMGGRRQGTALTYDIEWNRDLMNLRDGDWVVFSTTGTGSRKFDVALRETLETAGYKDVLTRQRDLSAWGISQGTLSTPS